MKKGCKTMIKDGMYSSGTFANMAHVTKKTLRYYDEHNILKPSFITDTGAKYYTDNDFAKLQQIIFLKYLSFPLEDIKELTLRNSDRAFWLDSLNLQTSLLEEHIEQLKLMQKSLNKAKDAISTGRDVDWSEMLLLANSNEMEQKLKDQFTNSSNISARIKLHSMFSQNKEDWFRWLFDLADIKPLEVVFELGCGDGSFWLQNRDRFPHQLHTMLTDVSAGIVRDTKRHFENVFNVPPDGLLLENRPKGADLSFYFKPMDAHRIEMTDLTTDLIIANHMLFYCENIPQVLRECRRVLKNGGRLLCSTYSSLHMQEVNALVKEFDDRISLSAGSLYERFGKENGKEILSEYFEDVTWHQYEDSLIVSKPEPLIAYILSCHGNQNRYIVDRYHEFAAFVKQKTDKGFHITKDAGAFICRAIK